MADDGDSTVTEQQSAPQQTASSVIDERLARAKDNCDRATAELQEILKEIYIPRHPKDKEHDPDLKPAQKVMRSQLVTAFRENFERIDEINAINVEFKESNQKLSMQIRENARQFAAAWGMPPAASDDTE